ncbi:MAG: 2-amino-4-hydroxy-6-hydroxymethyldihydropteridine diphosphokinase [Cytophagales bacterium]
MQKQEAYLGLGSNLGDKKENIEKACNLISSEISQIIGFSSFYQTEPWGNSDQAEYLNRVVRIFTDLEPGYLLAQLHKIEDQLGRIRDEKWGARTIDIDLLYYGHFVIDRDDLIIPHPELIERNFVLEPLTEMAPNYLHPVFQLTNRELLEFCTDTSKVSKC